MSLFKAIVDGIVASKKDTEKKKKPYEDDYERLKNDPFLNDSAYLNYLVDHAPKDDHYDVYLDIVHEHMNHFNDRVDVFSVPSYMKVSEKIIHKKGGW